MVRKHFYAFRNQSLSGIFPTAPIADLKAPEVPIRFVQAAPADEKAILLEEKESHQVLIAQEPFISATTGVFGLLKRGRRGDPSQPWCKPVKRLKNGRIENYSIAGTGDPDDEPFGFDLFWKG